VRARDRIRIVKMPAESTTVSEPVEVAASAAGPAAASAMTAPAATQAAPGGAPAAPGGAG